MTFKIVSKIKVPQINAAVAEAGKRGLYQAGEHILGVSNQQVPHEEGDFERSGAVTATENFQVAISYDDTAFPGQAEWLHENMSIRHDSGRNAKFLENAMNSEANTAQQIIATAFRSKF
jgi:hypothetical protein